ncbi:ATP-binding response regulator [Pseudorhodoferax sp.]|uniref:ATP-binding response regulator n=1 Tax=Pseudorhodoferax sp. TaxID=1993553 RepID=UPI002DD65C41|nr:response regulator [Pseudorhodoferax sp.]
MHKVSITIDRSQHTVLVVDDTPATRYSTCRILSAAGFQVVEAGTGGEGMDRARAGGISAVVLDVHLPDIDGFTVCRMLRQLPETVVLPVLHLSATYVETSDKVAGLNSGADAYLEHPVDGAILVATLQALIRARIAEDQLRETEQRYRQLLLEREQAARANAERRSRTKDDFVAVLSHELRNPLNAILMNVHVLLRKEPPPAFAKGLDAIRRNAQTQARIISDILDVSRINSGKLTLQREAADPAALLQSSIDAMRQQLDSRQLQLVLDVQATGAVLLDPARFQQIFWNIFNNAIKFSHPGGSVHVALQRTPAQLELTVMDHGKGIAPAFLNRVFEKFTQSEAPGKSASGGLGLGLSIVKHLAELHGGGVVLDSAGLDAGTTVRVWFPLEGAATDDSAAPDSTRGALDEAALAGLSGRRVLVVEDDRDAAEMLGHILEDRGAQIAIAGDHDSGLQALEAQRPDLLVSDIGLPGQDGYALIRRWRALEAERDLPRLPAIALTAFGRPDDRAMALDAGFDVHIAKPFEPRLLLDAIRRLML